MNAPKDDEFKWFGEGFNGFPKFLPEDCVEYTIYILSAELKDLELRNSLRRIQASSTSLTKKLLHNFIWQRESFALELIREDGRVLFFLPSISG